MIAWSRKYRPAKVSELDQKRVREFLGQVLKSGKVSQAYLFSGPKGTGKTSTARILAAVLNCEKNKQKVAEGESDLSEPCGKCESCVSVRKGSSGSVIEIDAASNRGIDDIRLLKERVGIVPGGATRAVYIIDEVHMLTKEAFNALLKTLEEPPEHVVFCLCTTEEHKLLPTIVSRCTKVGFVSATGEEVVRSLKRVVEGEGIEVSDKALERLAKVSGGSFRDGVKFLERLGGVGKEITVDLIAEELGIVSDEGVEALLEFLLAAEAKKALDLVVELSGNGVEAEQLVTMMIEKAQVNVHNGLEQGKVDKNWIDFIDVFSKAYSRFSSVPIASLPLEMAIVEYCLKIKPSLAGGGGSVIKNLPAKKKALNNKNESEKKAVEVNKEVESTKVESKKSSVDEKVEDEEKVELEVDVQEEVVVDVGDKDIDEVSGVGEVEVGDGAGLSMDAVKSSWRDILVKVQEENHGLMALLKRVELVECDGGNIQMRVGYKFHKEQIEQDRYLRILESVFESVLGERVRFKVEVSKGLKLNSNMAIHENVSGKVASEDQNLISAVEDVFGV